MAAVAVSEGHSEVSMVLGNGVESTVQWGRVYSADGDPFVESAKTIFTLPLSNHKPRIEISLLGNSTWSFLWSFCVPLRKGSIGIPWRLLTV